MTRAQFELHKGNALAALDILAVARWLGIEVRGDRASCPFHSEHSIGAFQLNVKKCYCYCHSCHQGADAIGLTAHVNDVRPAEALRQLNSVFGLGLPLDNISALEEKKAQEQYEKRQAHKHFIKTITETLKNILRELKEWAQTLYPRSSGDEWNARYIFATKEYDIVAVYLEALNEDIILSDVSEQANRWLKTMQKLDPELELRQRIKARISDMFLQFIEGKITFETLIKKHEKAAREYGKLQHETR